MELDGFQLLHFGPLEASRASSECSTFRAARLATRMESKLAQQQQQHETSRRAGIEKGKQIASSRSISQPGEQISLLVQASPSLPISCYNCATSADAKLSSASQKCNESQTQLSTLASSRPRSYLNKSSVIPNRVEAEKEKTKKKTKKKEKKFAPVLDSTSQKEKCEPDKEIVAKCQLQQQAKPRRDFIKEEKEKEEDVEWAIKLASEASECDIIVEKVASLKFGVCWPLLMLLIALSLLGGCCWPKCELRAFAKQLAGNQSDSDLSEAVWATMSTQSSLLGVGQSAAANGTANSLSADSWTATLQARQKSLQKWPLEAGQSESSAAGGWLAVLLDFGRIFLMSAIIVGDICGNSLVILSVCRHSKLRVTTNWFVVSLACADILVALFAMTFNASVIISGRWLFSAWLCDFWNSCDVLASTASILHLCCISIDRYIAIMRPLDYPMKITTRRVVYALCAVWISSALLSCIPIFTGIYTTAEHIEWQRSHPDQCEFSVNRVYAIVSSSISFWIPCCIMVFTYYRIYCEASRQEKFIYKAQSMMPQPMPITRSESHHHSSGGQQKQRRSKSVAVASSGSHQAGHSSESRIRQLARQQREIQSSEGKQRNPAASSAAANTQLTTTSLGAQEASRLADNERASSLVQLNQTGQQGEALNCVEKEPLAAAAVGQPAVRFAPQQNEEEDSSAELDDSNSGQSTPTKRSISKMKREHKAAKTLGIIMGVFIICWLPFFSWYTPMNICGHQCDQMIPKEFVTILFWIGYFNSTLNPIIYAYFNHEFRDAFKKTLQWIFCCCNDLKCLRVSRPNDNQHYNCTYRSTQEIGLVSNS